METTRTYLNMETEIRNNILIITIDKLVDDISLLWHIKIVHNHKVLYESGYCKEDRFEYSIEESGKYLIFYQAKLNSKVLLHERDAIWYYTESQYDEFENFYRYGKQCCNENLPLWELKYPYQNMALITWDDEYDKISYLHNGIEKIGNKLQLYKLADLYNVHNEVIASLPPLINNEEITFFSGKATNGKKLIMGQFDLEDECSKEKIFNDVGYYSVIHQNANGIIMTNDYYGMYPLYSYEGNKIKIVCNSFHMLARILKILGQEITLNIDNILPYFICGQRMLFEQLINHECFIKEIRKLEIHKKYIVNLKGGVFVDKEIAEILQLNKKYDVKEYKVLLDKAAQEIIHNIEIVIKDDRYKKITCDVTGGKDSRTVLGALLNCCDGYEDKIAINSNDVPYTNDKSVFIPLNNLHNLKYKNDENRVEITDITEVINQNRSATMGVCFSRSIPYEYKGSDVEKSEIKLLGAGEPILRTTYSSYFDNVNYTNTNSIVNSIVKYYNNGEVDLEKVKKELTNELNKGMEELLGQDSLEIFNNHYMYFRNTYHFGLEAMLDSINNNYEIWSPLYTKTTGLIWHMVCSEFKNMRFQIEMIDKLCPLLLKIPFESVHDQKEFAKILNSENNLDKRFRQVKLELDNDDTNWERAKKERQQKRVIRKSERDYEVGIKNKDFYDNFYESIMYKLNKILHYNLKFKDTIGLDLYWFLKNNKNEFGKSMSKNIIYMCNKITSVTDIIDVLDWKIID